VRASPGCRVLGSCTVRGWPRWCDRFGQYGMKMSFWGSETLKIATIVEITSKDGYFGWIITTARIGVLISG